MTVQDVMAKSPAVATPQTSLHEVARMMVDHDCGAIPVVEGQEAPRPIGIITDRDIVVRLVAENKNPLDATVSDAMTKGAATVEHDQSLEAALEVMEQNQIRRVVVVDASGVVIGVVSQADVALNTSSQQTDELLKAVSDEETLLSDKMPMGGSYSG